MDRAKLPIPGSFHESFPAVHTEQSDVCPGLSYGRTVFIPILSTRSWSRQKLCTLCSRNELSCDLGAGSLLSLSASWLRCGGRLYHARHVFYCFPAITTAYGKAGVLTQTLKLHIWAALHSTGESDCLPAAILASGYSLISLVISIYPCLPGSR